MQYVALDPSLSRRHSHFPSLSRTIRTAIGLLSLSLLSFAVFHQAADQPRGKDVAAAGGDSHLDPSEDLDRILIQPHLPSGLQLMPGRSADPICCLVVYAALLSAEGFEVGKKHPLGVSTNRSYVVRKLESGAEIRIARPKDKPKDKEVAGRLYGAKQATKHSLAVPTGKPEDITEVDVLCWPPSTFQTKLRIADEVLGFDPEKPTKGNIRRDVVAVVVKGGGTIHAYWHYQAKSYFHIIPYH
eukprot:g43526.t1